VGEEEQNGSSAWVVVLPRRWGRETRRSDLCMDSKEIFFFFSCWFSLFFYFLSYSVLSFRQRLERIHLVSVGLICGSYNLALHNECHDICKLCSDYEPRS